MANEYRTWYSSTEQDWVVQCDSFLVNVVGWYRVFTYSDTSSDRHYAWLSEGEARDKRPPRIISIDSVGNNISLDCLQVAPNGFNFTTGAYNTYVGSSAETVMAASTPGRCRNVASKDRLFMSLESSPTAINSGYVGFIDSFYSPLDDPNPIFVRASRFTTSDWTDTSQVRMLRSDDTEQRYDLNWDQSMVDEGYPNPRSGEYTFKSPEVYYTEDVAYNEVRGRPKGLYIGKVDRLAHGAFVNIKGEPHLCTKMGNQQEVIVVGPVSSNGQVPPYRGWQNTPDLKIDYTHRGLQVDVSISGTLALWRFDTGHLDGYVYGSGSALPVPTVYPDTTGNYNLTPQGTLTSVESRLREAASFDGATQYASASGDVPARDALKSEWTFECVFMPAAIPTSTNRATLLDFSTAGGTSASNILLRVSIAPAVGPTPDIYNVGRGNVDILWEKGTATSINSLTNGDFIQQSRWNYLAIVKKQSNTPTKYDIDVWHCSFGDHTVPVKRATFTGVDNATDGTSSNWYIGVAEDLTQYLDGLMDDTRITERALTDEEIINSCSRSML